VARTSMASVLAAPEPAPVTDRAPAQVRVTGLTKSYRRRREAVPVLKDVDLSVTQGELLVLLGPSGCGKTTLLKCLVGLERPDSGRIDLGGTAVVDAGQGVFAPPNHRDVGMVFQNYALWPHMTVARNVAYPLKARKHKADLENGRVEEVLSIVQCAHLADRYPPELSGGQQQRISLARALAPRPALLLLDEPLSNLDALLRIELRAQLRILHRDLGFTGVYVTHDQDEALALGTRIAVMWEGRIEQIGLPEEVFRVPATEYVADFLGARNTLELTVGGGGAATVAGRAVAGLELPDLGAGTYHVRVRPHSLAVRPAGETADADDRSAQWVPGGRLLEMVPGTEKTEHVIALGEERFVAEVPNDRLRAHVGDEVEIGFEVARSWCYTVDGERVEAWGAAR
jgi:iron(III) transport system ATP-binding protein